MLDTYMSKQCPHVLIMMILAIVKMTVLTVVTDTVKIFVLCQDIKYNKLGKTETTSVHQQSLVVSTHSSKYMRNGRQT